MEFWLLLVPLPFVAPLVLPRPWLPASALAVLYGATYLWIDDERASCGSCDTFSGLGVAIVWVAAIVFLVGMGVRYAWVLLRSTQESEGSSSKAAVRTTFALVAAGLATAVTTVGVMWLDAAFDSGWITHLSVLLLGACWFGVCRVAGAPSAFQWTGLLVILSLVGWSLSKIPAATHAADVAAEGAPYCLLVSSREGLREPRTVLDLTGFMMQADRGTVRHGVLAKGDARSPVWKYWSYRNGDFVPDFYRWVLSCEPRPAHAGSLPLWPGDTADPTFWLARGRWQMPRAYGGVASEDPPRLSFYAQGADFAPLPPGTLQRRVSSAMLSGEVTAILCTSPGLHPWQAENDANREVTQAGQQDGLDKVSVRWRSGGHEEFQYLQRDDAGHATSWLRCDAQGFLCRHAFMREGMVVEFQHAPGVPLAQWSELEDAAWRRIRSFSVAWPDRPVPSCQ